MPQGHPSHKAGVGPFLHNPQTSTHVWEAAQTSLWCYKSPAASGPQTQMCLHPPPEQLAVQARIPPWPVHKSHCIISFPHQAVPHETLESPVLPLFNVPTFFCLSFSFTSLPPLTCFCLWCQGSLCIWCHLGSSTPCSFISEPDMGHLWSGLYCLLPHHPHPQHPPPG